LPAGAAKPTNHKGICPVSGTKIVAPDGARLQPEGSGRLAKAAWRTNRSGSNPYLMRIPQQQENAEKPAAIVSPNDKSWSKFNGLQHYSRHNKRRNFFG